VKPRRRTDWNRLRKLALPSVEKTTSWDQPTLNAHGKLWVWWSPTCSCMFVAIYVLSSLFRVIRFVARRWWALLR
jgi:hypothetical protein